MTPKRLFDVPEVLDVQVVPSDEVRIVPFTPTETYNGLEVVLEVLSFLAQEKMVILKHEIRIMYKIFFNFSSIPKLKILFVSILV